VGSPRRGSRGELGIPVLVGSDAPNVGHFPGAGLHRKLEALVAAGGKEPDFGEIAVGKAADLLGVQGDPTRDIAAVHAITAVMSKGVLLKREARGE